MNVGGPCHCASPRIALPIMRADRFMQLWRLPGEKGCSRSSHPGARTHFFHFHSQTDAHARKVLVKEVLITPFITA